jgi:small-conductance mechanosensitive channel
MKNFLDNIYFGNSLQKWLIAVGIVCVGITLLYFIKIFAVKGFKQWSKRTNTTLDDFVVALFEKCLIPYLYFVSIIAAVFTLELSPKASHIFHVITLLVTTFFVLKAINRALQYLIFSFVNRHDEGEIKQRQVGGIVIIFKIVVWIVGIIFLLDNLGYNITTIIAGLGIGGIAIALAAQTFLGDLFCYFVILFDRPFEIGDFISVDDKMGEIEYIGIKTTRLRSLGGEQLICSNRYLTESRVHNFKRLQKRRVAFNLGVTYQTTPEMLEAIPAMVKEIISAKPDILFDRAHFTGFGNFSLNFEIVYFFLTADFNQHMDVQQQIFYEIYREFSNKEIAFAYPTQTLFVNQENAMNFQEPQELVTAKKDGDR